MVRRSLAALSRTPLTADTLTSRCTRRLMIVTGLITLATSVLFWFFFPDSPTSARFLTAEERVWAVRRIRVNQAGVENKHFKREQCVHFLVLHAVRAI